MPENDTDEVTLGEVNRNLNRLYDKVDALSTSANELDAIDRRVEHLESWQTWALRIVAGGVLVAILGLVITQT